MKLRKLQSTVFLLPTKLMKAVYKKLQQKNQTVSSECEYRKVVHRDRRLASPFLHKDMFVDFPNSDERGIVVFSPIKYLFQLFGNLGGELNH